MDDLTIAICYQAGTLEMLEVCLRAIQVHTEREYTVLVITREKGEGASEIKNLQKQYSFGTFIVGEFEDSGETDFISRILEMRPHGAMLDVAMQSIDTKYLLTLDSDCFPVADGWLAELVSMMDDDVACAGILHPWVPPAEDMDKKKVEYRVRSQHCWETTHVACQLVRTDFIKTNELKFAYGDDTGLEIPKRAKELGLRIKGWLPSRCANPSTNTFDAEFNRYVCLIWGDKVYHHGGYTRKSIFQDDKIFEENFGWVLPLLLTYVGAEFLLNDENSYQFKFDREEEVAAEKIQRLFGLKQDRMGG